MNQTPARIAFDARLLHWPGVGRYCLELATALADALEREQSSDMEIRWICLPQDAHRLPTTKHTRPMPAPITPLSMAEIWQLPRWLRKEKVHLMHSPVAHHIPWWGPPALISTLHDLILHHHPRLAPGFAGLAYYRLSNAIAIRRSQRVIAVSEFTRLEAIKVWRSRSSRFVTVLNGAAEKFRPVDDELKLELVRQQLALPPSYLLYVGTCKKHKNLPRLLEGYARLPAKLRADCPLVMLVQLRDRDPQINETIERLRLQSNLIWLASVNEEQLVALYSMARALVLVSLMEGFGLPVAEALSCGTPAIVSSSSAQAEVAGEAGLSCDPRDVDSIHSALRLIVEGDAHWTVLREQTRRQASRFRWPEAAHDILKIYRDTLAATRRK